MNNKSLFVLAATALLFPYLARADGSNVITLKCRMNGSEYSGDLQINLDERKAWWEEIFEYDVIKSDRNYITATISERGFRADVGSTIFVVDRVTGIMKMTNIGVFTDEKGQHPKLSTQNFEFRCAKPVL